MYFGNVFVFCKAKMSGANIVGSCDGSFVTMSQCLSVDKLQNKERQSKLLPRFLLLKRPAGVTDEHPMNVFQGLVQSSVVVPLYYIDDIFILWCCTVHKIELSW